MPPLTTGAGGMTFCNRPSGCLSVRPLTPMSLDGTSLCLVVRGISIKLVTNIHHVSGNC